MFTKFNRLDPICGGAFGRQRESLRRRTRFDIGRNQYRMIWGRALIVTMTMTIVMIMKMKVMLKITVYVGGGIELRSVK